MIEVILSLCHFLYANNLLLPFQLQIVSAVAVNTHPSPSPITLRRCASSSLSPTVFSDVAKTREVNGLCVNPAVTPGVKCSALATESIAISAADCIRAPNTTEIASPSYFINSRPLETRIATVCPRISSVTGDVFTAGSSVLGLFCVTVTDCTESCDPWRLCNKGAHDWVLSDCF